MKKIVLYALFFVTSNALALDLITKKIPDFYRSDIRDMNSEYLVIYPEKKEDKPPLLIFLHGAGERAEDIEILKKWGGPSPARFYRRSGGSPFLMIAPQCKKERRWNIDNLNAWFEYVLLTETFDKDRVYITGLSMGGQGTFRWAAENPEIFAAAAPVCGAWAWDGSKPSNQQLENLASIPFWIFHGDKDKVVPSVASKNMAKWIDEENNNKTILKIYKNLGHSIWNETYVENGRLYKWLLSKTKDK